MSEHESHRVSSSSWANVHPDFDGHLERPFENMTPWQRLEWLCSAVELWEIGRQSRESQLKQNRLPGRTDNRP